MPDPTICCGSAGIYNLVEPATAQELGDRKAQNCLATGAEMAVAGNPGCLLQIRAALERAGSKLPVLHTIELLDAATRGVSKDALLRNGARGDGSAIWRVKFSQGTFSAARQRCTKRAAVHRRFITNSLRSVISSMA